jgi:hypothetical protein
VPARTLAQAYARLGAEADGRIASLPRVEHAAALDLARSLLATENAPPPSAPVTAPTPASGAPIPVRSSGTRHELLAPDAWLDVRHDPARAAQGIEIADPSGFGYAVSLLADDFAGVRLDGGLVVPGRLYRVHGTARITADVPVHVHIRPVAGRTDVRDRPLHPPAGDG